MSIIAAAAPVDLFEVVIVGAGSEPPLAAPPARHGGHDSRTPRGHHPLSA